MMGRLAQGEGGRWGLVRGSSSTAGRSFNWFIFLTLLEFCFTTSKGNKSGSFPPSWNVSLGFSRGLSGIPASPQAAASPCEHTRTAPLPSATHANKDVQKTALLLGTKGPSGFCHSPNLGHTQLQATFCASLTEPQQAAF